MAAVPGTYRQWYFRGYQDGAENSSTAIAAENANFSQALNTIFQIRFKLQESTNGLDAIGWQLQYNVNGAGWNDVNASSLKVRSAPSAFLTDLADCTERLTSNGAYTADNDGVEDVDGLTGSKAGGWSLANWEVLYSIQLRSADLVVGDTLQLRVVKQGGGVLNTYTNTPTITVTAAPAGSTNREYQGLHLGLGIGL